MILDYILQCYSIFATFAIFGFFAIKVSQCFAKFRKSCFASFANASFARFCKYFFSQFYVCFARFARFRRYKSRKVSRFSVSQEFANKFIVSQASQVFRNGQFAQLCWWYDCEIAENSHDGQHEAVQRCRTPSQTQRGSSSKVKADYSFDEWNFWNHLLSQKIGLKCVLENLGSEYLMFALVQLKSILVPQHQSLGVWWLLGEFLVNSNALRWHFWTLSSQSILSIYFSWIIFFLMCHAQSATVLPGLWSLSNP